MLHQKKVFKDCDLCHLTFMLGWAKQDLWGLAAESLCMGAFNNYVDKKRGRGGQPKVHACPPGGGELLNVNVDRDLAIS